MNKIGESLKEVREENKKSVYDVEKEIGISHQNIYKWEKGESEPSITACIRLAKYYNCTIDYLVGIENKKEQQISKYYKCNITANGNNKL